MITIPVINCTEYLCVENRMKVLETLEVAWVKFDISDGSFTDTISWNNPEELLEHVPTFFQDYNVEVHLMEKRPESDVYRWLSAGASRIILHVESDFDLDSVLEVCRDHDAELMISKNPSTSLDAFDPYFDSISFFQFLAVSPGPSGQELQKSILEEITALRESHPDVKIEVDGGINEETARMVKDAGADIIVSSSYIFKSNNPQDALKKLQLI